MGRRPVSSTRALASTMAVIGASVLILTPSQAGAGVRAAAQQAVVTKTPSPTSQPEPGGTFTFTIVVSNTSFFSLTIQSMNDDVHGNLANRGSCNTAAGTTLQAGTQYTCSYTAPFNGNAGASQTSTTTVSAQVAVANPGGGFSVANTQLVARATVTITDVAPTVGVTKSPSPASLPAPGGTFTYTVDVTNTSPEPVTITALTDDIYGNLANNGSCTTAVGTVLQPQASYTCNFPGPFSGAANTSLTDQVTVRVVDDDGTSASAQATATVTITPGGTLPPNTTTTTASSTTTTSTTSTTTPPDPSSTVPTIPRPPTTTAPPPGLELVTGPSSEPGGEVETRGTGCLPNSPVALLLGTATAESPIGSAQAGANGSFVATIELPDLPVGRVLLSALCGPRLTAPLDIVVSSQVDTGTPTLAVFIFFVLLSLALFRRRRVILPQRRPDRDDDLV